MKPGTSLSTITGSFPAARSTSQSQGATSGSVSGPAQTSTKRNELRRVPEVGGDHAPAVRDVRDELARGLPAPGGEDGGRRADRVEPAVHLILDGAVGWHRLKDELRLRRVLEIGRGPDASEGGADFAGRDEPVRFEGGEALRDPLHRRGEARFAPADHDDPVTRSREDLGHAVADEAVAHDGDRIER